MNESTRVLRAVLLFCLLMSWNTLLGQNSESVTFKAQIRSRSETDHRDFSSGTDLNTYTYLRTRFGAALTPAENVSAFIQVQDARVYGKEPGTLSNTANLDLHQAYFKVNHFLFNWLDVKLGRMEISYGEERLVGAVGWSNIGRTFDGGVSTINFSDKFKLDVFSARLQESSTPAPVATPGALANSISDENDRNFSGLYGKLNSSQNFKADFYLLTQIDGTDVQGENELEQFTLGTFLRGKRNNWSYKTEVAVQAGKQAGADIGAYMLTGTVGYTFAEAKWSPTLSLGYDLISGDNDGTDNDNNAFSTLFATNHKFYGYMDYFVNVPAQTSGLGLQDMMIKLRVKPAPKWSVDVHFHNFRSAKDSRNGFASFGQEIDVVPAYTFHKNFKWTAGLSLFVPGDLMNTAFGGNDNAGFWSHSSFIFNF